MSFVLFSLYHDSLLLFFFFFFFNDTATTEIYTLSLHDALPISILRARPRCSRPSRATARHRRAIRFGAEPGACQTLVLAVTQRRHPSAVPSRSAAIGTLRDLRSH